MADSVKRTITVEDLWALGRVGAPAVSPDGARLVVPVTRYDMDKNEGRTRLWLVDAAGGTPRCLTSEEHNSSAPAWSPDGTRIAFVRSKPGEKAQLHVLPLEGGEPEKLTDLPLGCLDPRWFPDGGRIAFVAPLLGEALTVEGTRELLETRKKDPVKAAVTEDRVYRFWDRWLTEGEVPHIFVLDLASGELRDLIPDSTRWFEMMDPAGQYDISPDGREIAFSANASTPPHARINWDVYTVPVAGGPAVNLTEDNPLDDFRPRYSRDGRYIVYGMQVKYGFYADRVRLVRFDRTTGEHKHITEGWDRSASNWEFSRTTTDLFLAAEDRGRAALYSVPIEGAIPKELHRGGVIHEIAPSAAGRVHFTEDSLLAPSEVGSVNEDGSDFRWVTRVNGDALAALQFGAVEERQFAGAGGKPVQMFLVFPPGFDPKKKYPLVHMIHGGPHGIFGDQFHFRWNPHLFGAPGYVVALVNFHGSTSWGQDFAECIQGAWGEKPYEDVMAATDLLEKEPWVDATRMAATGGSYGGYMVAWIAGHTDRFACLVNHAGVSDLFGQYASDVTQGDEIAIGGTPHQDLEVMEKWSPLRYASRFKTPMLVIHGEKDYRVPYQQGLAIYNAYKAMGLPARLVVFPDENHWVLKPQNSRLWYRELHGWLGRFLAACLLVAACCGVARAQAPSATELLARAGKSFQALPSYHVHAQKTLDLVQGTKTQHAESTMDFFGAPDGKERQEMTGQVFAGQYVNNGDSTWVYIGGFGQYSAHANASTAAVSGIEGVIRGLLATPRDELLTPDRNINGAAYVRAETLTVAGTARPCHLVEVQYPAGADSDRVEAQPKRLWLDVNTGMVVRTQLQRAMNEGTPGGAVMVLETNTFERVEPVNKMPDSTFTFQPPPGVKRVTDLHPEQPQAEAPLAGREAPEFTLKDLKGATHTLKGMRGKIVLLDFWATWCGPCRIEMPSVQKLAKDHARKGLVVWAVNVAEDPDRVQEFIDTYKYSMGVLLDTGEASRLYQASSIPTVVVIDKKGMVSSYFRGVQSEETLLAALKKAGLP